MIECPACKNPALNISFNKHNIPHFGEVMESLAVCSSCGYRHVDVFSLEEKMPCKYSLQIEKSDDMLTRVVRSSRSTVKVPELGVEITPGPLAEGYVSNVEGVLDRIAEVIMTIKSRGDPKKQKKANELMGKIKSIKEGKTIATLIIEDPSGNSAIISERALKEKF